MKLPYLLITLALAAGSVLGEISKQPNIVLIFTDDQGYGDVGCYGAEGYTTPHLDRMAAEGVKFTDFYVAQAVCGASRAALLTGCYPNRIGIKGAPGPGSKIGLHPDEMTIAEVVKQKDYATAIFGKWHLGDAKEFLPVHQGFDEYYGLPYSNDMWPYHPNVLHLPMEDRLKRWPVLPMVEGDEIVDAEVTPEDQTRLTGDYTRRAVKFIEKNKDKPFFLYLAHSMPHVPLYTAKEFEGSSEQGAYGDVIQEIDWSVGQVLESLAKNGLDDNTLVIFTCDNGPWLSYGNHGGSAGPLREGKGTTWEGGVRVPCIMRWPGKIPAGSVCREPAMTIDLLPTIAALTDTPLPKRKIDGNDIWSLISGQKDAKSPGPYYFFWGTDLHAVRSGKWKYHFPHAYRSLTGEPGMDGLPGGYTQAKTDVALYDLHEDIGKQKNIIEDHPDIAKKLRGLGENFAKKLEEEKRPAGQRGA
ncbi:MAG: sulfatase [Verrucomicrobiota bacterium]